MSLEEHFSQNNVVSVLHCLHFKKTQDLNSYFSINRMHFCTR